MMNVFMFKGKVIEDVPQWCRDNGYSMVRYRIRRRLVVPMSCRIYETVEEGEMPELAWDSLLTTDGSTYEELSRYQP